MYKTTDVLERFNISRQTLQTWEKTEVISSPSKDWRGWKQWTDKHIDEIEGLLKQKAYSQAKKENTERTHFEINNRRYLGAKTKLLPFIEEIVQSEIKEWDSFTDLFGGTGVVANHFNMQGKQLIVNDILHSNYHAYHTFFSEAEYDPNAVEMAISHLNGLVPQKENYFSSHYGNTFFTMENALKIGAIRDEIENLRSEVNERERSILITSLLYAADKVANTCGHYEAYRKKLDTLNEVKLLQPVIVSNEINKNNKVYRDDANQLVKDITTDILYIDPPYNSRQYVDSYHLLENLTLWEKPIVSGVAKKMVDRSYAKSNYCIKKAPVAFDDLIQHANAKWIIISYSNMAEKGDGRSNAKISDTEILESLSKRGETATFSQQFQQFTTGLSNINDLEERLFICKVNKGMGNDD